MFFMIKISIYMIIISIYWAMRVLSMVCKVLVTLPLYKCVVGVMSNFFNNLLSYPICQEFLDMLSEWHTELVADSTYQAIAAFMVESHTTLSNYPVLVGVLSVLWVFLLVGLYYLFMSWLFNALFNKYPYFFFLYFMFLSSLWLLIIQLIIKMEIFMKKFMNKNQPVLIYGGVLSTVKGCWSNSEESSDVLSYGKYSTLDNTLFKLKMQRGHGKSAGLIAEEKSFLENYLNNNNECVPSTSFSPQTIDTPYNNMTNMENIENPKNTNTVLVHTCVKSSDLLSNHSSTSHITPSGILKTPYESMETMIVHDTTSMLESSYQSSTNIFNSATSLTGRANSTPTSVSGSSSYIPASTSSSSTNSNSLSDLSSSNHSNQSIMGSGVNHAQCGNIANTLSTKEVGVQTDPHNLCPAHAEVVSNAVIALNGAVSQLAGAVDTITELLK